MSSNLPVACMPREQCQIILQHVMQALGATDRNIVSSVCELLTSMVREHEDSWEEYIAALLRQYGVPMVSALLHVYKLLVWQ